MLLITCEGVLRILWSVHVVTFKRTTFMFFIVLHSVPGIPAVIVVVVVE
jgi:hypothetical protein